MGLRAYFLERKVFFCCLPVRFGAVVMSLLTLVLAGAVSFYLWFEVGTVQDPPMDSDTHLAFILAGAVESLLFLASIFGFVGAVVRKQSFVQLYSWFIWLHLLLNLAVGSFFMYVVIRDLGAGRTQCKEGVLGTGEQQLCGKVLNIAEGVLIALIVVIWLVEIYGALVIARYTHQIRAEKREGRRQRLESRAVGRSEAHVGLLAPPVSMYEPMHSHENEAPHEMGPPVYGADEREGYGGGRWSLQEISAEEKKRLREAGDDLA